MEKFWFLRVRVLWEKRKHNYMLLQQTSSLLVLTLRLLSSLLLPRSNLLRARAKHWAKSPWCAVKFWQAWALPGGSQAGPSGQLWTDCEEMELVVQGSPVQAGGIPEPYIWWAQAPRDLSTPCMMKLGGCSEFYLLIYLFMYFIYWLHFWPKHDGLVGWFSAPVCMCFWSQWVLNEIQSGAQTRDALAGELIRTNNVFLKYWAQKISVTEYLSEAPYENRPSGFTAVYLLTLQPTTVSLLGDTCWICHTSRVKL